ncbi:hypothetical protein GCM10025791_28710 [Halioxenophilus aromaticivorans]|uniref:Uncharacterized protein n=1 Tax=Halioxenophilus aromaticivorans TaxID=1306992 RepID=A0AAV3U4S4_9ALTE
MAANSVVPIAKPPTASAKIIKRFDVCSADKVNNSVVLRAQQVGKTRSYQRRVGGAMPVCLKKYDEERQIMWARAVKKETQYGVSYGV